MVRTAVLASKVMEVFVVAYVVGWSLDLYCVLCEF